MDLYNKTSIINRWVIRLITSRAIRGLNIAWQEQLATNNTDKTPIISSRSFGGQEVPSLTTGHEESNGAGNQTSISDVIRDGLFDIFTQRHMIGEVEGNSDIDLRNKYEESESAEENVISEDNSPSYLNTVKTEETSSDDGEIQTKWYYYTIPWPLLYSHTILL